MLLRKLPYILLAIVGVAIVALTTARTGVPVVDTTRIPRLTFDTPLEEPSYAEEWLPIRHSNPSFPTDIVCESHSGRCIRSCQKKRRNKITYIDGNAGLLDRAVVFASVAELAGYLCATVYVKKPRESLYVYHNNGQQVDDGLQWSEVLNYTYHDGMTALKDISVQESAFSREQKDGALENWEFLSSNRNSTDLLQPFLKALSISVKEPSSGVSYHFSWEIDVNWWFYRYSVIDYLKKTSASDASLHVPDLKQWNHDVPGFNPPVFGPYLLPGILTSHWSPYLSLNLPSALKDIAGNIWASILTEVSSEAIFGTWHLRRQDTAGMCDTSLKRMEAYVKCTFRDTEKLGKRIVVLLRSDERDQSYLQALNDFFTAHAPHVKLFFLEQSIQSFLWNEPTVPTAYKNQYHKFLLGQALVNDVTVFQLSHRREFDCRDCYNLANDLL